MWCASTPCPRWPRARAAIFGLVATLGLACGNYEVVLGSPAGVRQGCPRGCDDGDPCTADRCVEAQCQHAPLDRDGDGHLPPGCGGDDCDDRDPAIHPLATEGPAGTPTCGDGRDNDCDGAVDGLDSACQRGAGLCTPDGFCWVTPTPTGNVLLAAWGSGPDDVWFAGEEGTLLRWDGAGLSGLVWPELIEFAAQLHGLSILSAWGTGPDDVWFGANFGRLLHWDGRGLALAEVPFAQESWDAITHLWGFGADALWLLHGEAMWRRQAGAWTELPGPPERLSRVVARARDQVWGIDSHHLYRWDGAAWQTRHEVETWLTTLWAFAADDIWLGDNAGMLLHFDGQSWSQQPLPDARQALDLWGASPTELWAVGNGLYRWDGARWVATGIEPGAAQRLWSAAGVDLWAFGWGEVAHAPRPDPAALQSEIARAPWSLVNAMGGTSGQDLWLSDNLSSVRHWDGAAWTEHAVEVHLPEAVWARAPDDAWIAGSSDIARWDGQRWRQAVEAPHAWYQAIHGSGADDVWAVAYDGVVARFDGSAWSQQPSPTQDHLYAVWAFDPADVWIAGEEGVWQWDGAAWQDRSQTNGPRYCNAASLWGMAPDDLWLATGLSLYHWDGGAWAHRHVADLVNHRPRRVWGAASDQVWFGGDDGKVLRWDGAALQEVRSGMSIATTIEQLWVAPDNEVWIAADGALLRRLP